MYDRILVPTDGSPVAEQAGAFAVAVADALDSHLHVMNVVEGGSQAAESDQEWGESAVESIAAVAEDRGVEHQTTVLQSSKSVHLAIIDYAIEHDMSAIIIGTHGRTGVNRFLLGSVAEQTLRESPIPVLTVHEDTDVDFEIENVLVPTDGSAGAEAAAEHAVELAAEMDATIHALTVTDAGSQSNGDPSPLDTVEELVAEAGLGECVGEVRSGRPHEEIASYIAEAAIDCVVMGTHGRTGLRRYLLGSVTERTVRFSPVPVISITAPRDAAEVEYLNYETVMEKDWSIDDPNLFEKAAEADLTEADYGTIAVGRGEYLLEAAESEGYQWPFHCRAGGCVNCAGVLIDGDLEMERNRSLSDDEVDELGIRLTCVATPASDRVRIVYNAQHLDALADRVM